MTAILRAWYLASAYSMPVRERELELNSVIKSNTSGSGKALILGARFISHVHAYLLLIGYNEIAESLKDGGIV